MLDTGFDPLKALQDLNNNQKVLFSNDQNLAAAIEGLRGQIRQQQEVIDILIQGLDMANKANEQLLKENLDNLIKQFKETANG